MKCYFNFFAFYTVYLTHFRTHKSKRLCLCLLFVYNLTTMLSLSPVRYKNRDRDCSVTKYFNDTIGMQSFARWQLCCIQIASECCVAIRQRGLGRGSSTTFCSYCGFYILKHFTIRQRCVSIISLIPYVCIQFVRYVRLMA